MLGLRFANGFHNKGIWIERHTRLLALAITCLISHSGRPVYLLAARRAAKALASSPLSSAPFAIISQMVHAAQNVMELRSPSLAAATAATIPSNRLDPALLRLMPRQPRRGLPVPKLAQNKLRDRREDVGMYYLQAGGWPPDDVAAVSARIDAARYLTERCF